VLAGSELVVLLAVVGLVHGARETEVQELRAGGLRVREGPLEPLCLELHRFIEPIALALHLVEEGDADILGERDPRDERHELLLERLLSNVGLRAVALPAAVVRAVIVVVDRAMAIRDPARCDRAAAGRARHESGVGEVAWRSRLLDTSGLFASIDQVAGVVGVSLRDASADWQVPRFFDTPAPGSRRGF
jgi:hypothetical protein